MPKHLTNDWEQLSFAYRSESVSTTTMSQTLGNGYGVLSVGGAGPNANSSQAIAFYPTLLNYPSGSGTQNRWGDAFTMQWMWDLNVANPDVERWFIWGRDNAAAIIAVHPEDSNNKFLGIKRYTIGSTEYVEAMINDGTDIYYSDSVSIGDYNLHKKAFFCCTWDGSVLKVYGVYKTAYGYQNDENYWQMELLCSVTYTGSLTASSSFTNYDAYFMDYYLASGVTNSSTVIGNVKFRRGVSPPI